jgi:broad specificity phosphatase PhoE
MILFCIRHGESDYNAQGRIQGHSDRPELSELGWAQSRAVAGVLAAADIEAIYASPLRRARQTAEAIAARTGLPIQSDPRLMEVDVGVFQERIRAELDRDCSEALARWSSGDPDARLPGGESRRELAARGREAFAAIARSGRRRVAVVSHGGLLVTTIKSLLGIPLSEPPLALQNGSITRLAIESDGTGGGELLGLDESAHLAQLRSSGIGDLRV